MSFSLDPNLWSILLFFLFGLLIFLTIYFSLKIFLKLFLLLKLTSVFNLFKKITFPGVAIIVFYWMKTLSSKFITPLPEKWLLTLEAGLVFFIVVFFFRLLDGIISVIYQQKKKPFPLPRVLHGFILAVIYLVVFFVVLRSILRVNLTPFLATSALLTAILGLAFQGVLSNVIAGLSLHFSRSFNRGDWVKIGSYEGIVQEMNWRETILLDRQSNLVILPNNVVASEKIINFSRPDKASALILEIKINYGIKPSLVLKKLLEAADEVSEVLKNPAPQAFVASYDHLGLTYWLKFWIEDFSRKNLILGEVGRQVWYKFQRHGIRLSLPLNETLKEVLTTFEPQKALSEAKAEQEVNFAYLLNSNFLRYEEGEKAGELILPIEEIMALASRVKREHYSKGEIVFRQGEKGESCYLVAKGKLRGEILCEEKGRQYLSEFEVNEGEIVGEMSLFTGLPRTATIFVVEETELIRITSSDFAQLLEKHPHLSEVIAEIVSERARKNQDFLQKVQYLSSQDIEASCNPRSIIERFRHLLVLLREGEEERQKKKIVRPEKVS
ncbi:MAG: mechanosensitive ion channel [Candidatus Aminicenantes bacterium]|nr:mechanosensitive ion channel [Candidatus Aminicenantes bacterium]